MMKQLFLLFVLLTTLRGTAQIDSFDLRNFVLPDEMLKTLDFSGKVYGFNSETKKSSGAPNFEKGFKTDFSLRFYRFKNSLRHQKTASIFLRDYLRAYRKTDGFTYGRYSFDHTAQLTINTMNRRYFRSNAFGGIGLITQALQGKTTRVPSSSPQTMRSATLNVGVPIEFGVGRVENITSAWHAVRLLKDLEDEHLLAHSPTEEDILSLAEGIADSRYRRVFDERIGRKERLKEIDYYLKNSHLVRHDGIDYFTTLYDSYLYGLGGQSDRLSGHRLSLKMTIWKVLHEQKKNFLAETSYVSYHPINQYWQVNYSVNFFAGQNYFFSTKTDDNLSLNVYCFVGYYPNSRTSLTGAISYIHQDLFNIKKNRAHPFYGNINARYYLSPRTAIKALLVFNEVYYGIVTSVQFGNGEPTEGLISFHFQINHAFF